jgi:uncharacterized damage-inducible protein DinB
MTPAHAVRELTTTEEFFDRSTATLAEADSGFAPVPGMMTVAGQIAHTAHTIGWFLDGATGRGWDTNWEAIAARTAAVTSLESARSELALAFTRAREVFGAMSEEQLAAPLTANPFLAGPVTHVVEAIVDHTAHHRGALTVYARLRGQVPAMPYGA